MIAKHVAGCCLVACLGAATGLAAENDARFAEAAARGDLAEVRALLGAAPKSDVNAARGPPRSTGRSFRQPGHGEAAHSRRSRFYGRTATALRRCTGGSHGNAAMIRLLLDAGSRANGVAPTGET
jgi:hypothetical protein